MHNQPVLNEYYVQGRGSTAEGSQTRMMLNPVSGDLDSPMTKNAARNIYS